MSHYRDILDAEEDKRDKLHIEESLKLIQEFQRKAYTRNIQYELQSIEKYYKSRLYDLRHVD